MAVEKNYDHMASSNCDHSEKIEKMKDIKVKIRCGSSIVQVRPLFSYNSKCLIIASGPNVKVYSAQSGECLHTLRYHKSRVISIQENKDNCLQFFSCSQDGVVVRWEVVEGTILKIYNLHMAASCFYAPTPNPPWFITKRLKNSDEYRLYSLIPGLKQSTDIQVILHPVLPHQNAVSFGFDGSFVAAVYEDRLNIFKPSTKQFVRHICGSYKLTCVACHPSDISLATGDNQGRVLVWSNIFNSKKPIRSIYHWHSLPIADLVFSTEGSYLYSGGGEAALVKWNLSIEERSILPRLGAPIVWLTNSPDSSFVVTSLEDNSLQIINAQRNVVGVIQGLTRGHFQGDSKQGILSTGLLYDPQTKSLVMNGKPGHLQFYSVFEDKHLFNLDISARNFICHERDILSYNVDVCKAAIDEKGLWLATIEYWCNGEVSPMIWLKFWEYNVVKQMFVMNTNIYLPHDKEVNCIAFRPYDATDTSPMAVTTSNDCRFKTWTLYDDDSLEGKQSWNCASMDYYREHLPTGDISFSEDGSVLAVAANNIATLWTEENTHLEAALFQENNEKPIKQLRFGRNSCNHLLVCHDESKIYVWDVLSLSITFTIHVTVQTIAADVTSDLMVAFSKDNERNVQNLYLFKPNNPHPICFKKNISEKPILSAIFVPKSVKSVDSDEASPLEKSQLFFFSEDQCLLTLTDECDDDLDSNLKKIKMSRNLPITPFGFLQAEQKASSVKKIEHEPLVMDHKNSGKDTLEYSNPTYIDHFAICSKLLQSMLRPKPREALPIEMKPEKNILIENSDQSENLKSRLEPSEQDDLMETEGHHEAQDSNICITDFSFLQNYVNLPMS